jgi:hypothetical protein
MFLMLFPKGLFDGSNPDFAGTYSGAASAKPTQAAVEGADVLISVGVRFIDGTTSRFSQHIDRSGPSPGSGSCGRGTSWSPTWAPAFFGVQAARLAVIASVRSVAMLVWPGPAPPVLVASAGR